MVLHVTAALDRAVTRGNQFACVASQLGAVLASRVLLMLRRQLVMHGYRIK